MQSRGHAFRGYTGLGFRVAAFGLVGGVLGGVGLAQTGLSAAWQEASDHLVRIPMAATAASSLNAAIAASVVLYESLRQKTALRHGLGPRGSAG